MDVRGKSLGALAFAPLCADTHARTSSWALVLGGGVAFLGFSPKPLKLDLAGAAAGVASAADSPSSSVVGWGWVWGWWVRGCLSRLGVFRERCDSIGLDDRRKEGSGGWIDPLSMDRGRRAFRPPLPRTAVYSPSSSRLHAFLSINAHVGDGRTCPDPRRQLPPLLLLPHRGGGDEGGHRGGQREQQQDLKRPSHFGSFLSVCVGFGRVGRSGKESE